MDTDDADATDTDYARISSGKQTLYTKRVEKDVVRSSGYEQLKCGPRLNSIEMMYSFSLTTSCFCTGFRQYIMNIYIYIYIYIHIYIHIYMFHMTLG